MEEIKILVVDDWKHARIGIIDYLESCINAEYKFDIVAPDITIDYQKPSQGFDDLIELIEKYEPDVVTMDIDWGPRGHTSGIDASQLINHRYPGTHVIMFTYLSSQEIVRRAVQEGKVKGYITKGDKLETFPEAIIKVYRGENYFSPDVTSLLVDIVQAPNHLDLNNKEIKVLKCMAQGWSNSKIAREMKFGDATIRKRVSTIYEKIVYTGEENKDDIEPRVMAIRKGFELGYLDKHFDLPS